MKYFISLLCSQLIISMSFCQKIALIERTFEKPILFTDSVTISQVSQNYFPVRVDCVPFLEENEKVGNNCTELFIPQ